MSTTIMNTTTGQTENTDMPQTANTAPVLELLRDPNKWTKECAARDKYGNRISSISPEATCWCLLGAIEKYYPSSNDYWEAITKLQNGVFGVGYESIVQFNDDILTTHGRVIEVLEKTQI